MSEAKLLHCCQRIWTHCLWERQQRLCQRRDSIAAIAQQLMQPSRILLLCDAAHLRFRFPRRHAEHLHPDVPPRSGVHRPILGSQNGMCEHLQITCVCQRLFRRTLAPLAVQAPEVRAESLCRTSHVRSVLEEEHPVLFKQIK